GKNRIVVAGIVIGVRRKKLQVRLATADSSSHRVATCEEINLLRAGRDSRRSQIRRGRLKSNVKAEPADGWIRAGRISFGAACALADERELRRAIRHGAENRAAGIVEINLLDCLRGAGNQIRVVAFKGDKTAIGRNRRAIAS